MTRDEVKFEFLSDKQESVGLNRREAIELYCLKDSESSDESVKECSKKDCSLYAFRLSRGKQDPVDRDHAIKKQCMYCKELEGVTEITHCDDMECPLFPFRGYIRSKNMAKHLQK
jgi:hypothetical protein